MASFIEKIWNRLFGGSSANDRSDDYSDGCGSVAVQTEPVDKSSSVESESPVDEHIDRKSLPENPWWHVEGEGEAFPISTPRPELEGMARALENILVGQLDGHDLALPPLPEVAERVLKEMRSSDYKVNKVADAIGEDPVISAAVLRMSNSPLYGGMSKITSLNAAVARIGANALRTLMMHQSMRAAIFRKRGRDPQLGQMVWQRAVAGAQIMRGLCRFTHMDEEEAFLIGLMHDIGNVIVLREVLKQESILNYVIDVPTFDFLCDECHQEFGELIADAWDLPPDLKSLISNHHCDPEDDDPLRVQRFQLQLTDMILSLLSYSQRHEYNLLGSKAAQELGLSTSETFMVYLDRLPAELESTMQLA